MNDEGATRSQVAPASTVAVAATGALFSSTPAGPDGLVVKVHGDIDVRSAPILEEYAIARVAAGVRLIFDLSDVSFFAIAGLSVFRALDSASDAVGATWCLVEGHPVHRLLEAAAVVTTVTRFGSLEDALD